MEHYDIFISYRMDGGFETAKHLNDLLVHDGYTVSFDVDTLHEGDFGETLLKRIDQCVDFILVVDKHTFDKTIDPDFDSKKDWLRKELAYALKLRKNIIPIFLDGIYFPEGLPDDVKEIQHINGLYHNCEYFDAFYGKMKGFLRSQPLVAESHDIFLAYPRKDNKAGEKLSKTIQSNGFSVWRDITGIYTGEQFENCIINAISNSKTIIALYSSWALESAWFKKELEYAQKKNIPIIKVLTDTPEGLSGTRRMTFGTILEMGNKRFDEKLLSTILNNGCKPDTTEMLAYGKELYESAKKTNNLQDENTAFLTLMRAAELGDREALSYIETGAWNIDLKQAVPQYRSINSYFVQDLCADLYNRGEIIVEDTTLTDVEQRGRGMEKAAFRMMKRAIDLGFEGSNPIQYFWYYLTKDDFEECLDQLGESSRINEKVKPNVLVYSKHESQQGKTPYIKDRKSNSSIEKDKHRVFISYKRVDKEKVFEIKKTIESIIGEECWIDLDGIESDAQFAKVIIGAINRSVVFLFMYSSAHAAIVDYENDWTVRELNFAQKKRKRIVFINIDGSELTDWFEMIFGTKQQIDASSDLLMNNLYSDLKKWLNIDDVLSSPDKSRDNHSSQENKEDSFEDSIELQLAWMEYNDGNYKEALRSFLLEAKKGSANALNAIGLYYYEGKACSKNYQQAMFYFQKAADKGYASAMRNLGDCYRWGHGVKQDMDKSVFWYKKAAEKKNLKAIYLLALCYRDIDPLQADQYYLEAAHMGHEEAIKYVMSHGLSTYENDIKWTSYIHQNTKESVNDFKCLSVFKHKDAVESAVFSPNGKQIASASDDNILSIWNVESGERLLRLKGHSDSVTCVAYNSDGTRVVSASDDYTVKIWDLASGACLQTLCGHIDSVWSASFSPNDKSIVSASVDKTIRIWDVQSGYCVQTIHGHSMDVNYACFSPDGHLVASASEDGTIRIWNFADGKCIQILNGHRDGVWFASFSLDGEFIVSASADGTIRIWELKTGKCLKVLDGHTDDVNCVSFSADGRKILSASDDDTIRVWDSETGDCLQIIEGHSDFVNSAFFSPDGKRIVSASDDYTVKVWSI